MDMSKSFLTAKILPVDEADENTEQEWWDALSAC